MRTPNEIKYISLFSGIGGLDYGLHSAGCGFVPACIIEKDPHARATLLTWLHSAGISPEVKCDITEIDPKTLMEELGYAKGKLDLIVGGPPCQSFSLIGKKGSVGDARGQLVYKMVEYADIFRPKVVVMEQVKGLLRARDEDGNVGGVFSKVQSGFERLGYNVVWKVVNTNEYGVPQVRQRIIVVAVKGKKKFTFPAGASHVKTTFDAIGDLPKPVRKSESPLVMNHIDVTPEREASRISGVPEGQCLARQLHLPIEQRMKLNPKKDTTKYRRLSWHLPSLTLRCGEIFFHPEENRYLTPRECLRLHGYPDDFVLTGPIRARSGVVKTLDQHRQVANSVPPPLSKALGQALVSYFL